MITLIPNANQAAVKLIARDNVRQQFQTVCDSYRQGRLQVLFTNIQILITKIGEILAEISTPKQRIATFYQSSAFLCGKVLGDQGLRKRISDLKINGKGNVGKHSLTDNSTKGGAWPYVKTYNDLVTKVMRRYRLTAFGALLIAKLPNKKPKSDKPSKKKPAPLPQARQQVIRRPSVSMTPFPFMAATKPMAKPTPKPTRPDQWSIGLDASLIKGMGRYQKGLVHKKGMVNFRLLVKIDNPHGYPLKNVVALLRCGRQTLVRKLPRESCSITDFDLPTSGFCGNVQASIKAEYKVGLWKTRSQTISRSGSF